MMVVAGRSKVFAVMWFTVLALLALLSPARALDVQEITSAKGIKAWLVESHDIPIISLMFSMPGGKNFEQPGKEGAHQLLAQMLDEGAGDLSAAEVRALKARLSSRLAMFADSDFTSGYIATLSKNRDATAGLLQKMLETPRFDQTAFERLRDGVLQDIAQGAVDQTTIADDAWYKLALPGHIYGRPSQGTAQSVSALTTDDLRALWAATANRRELRVAVVGDITADELKLLLDRTFGNLPDFPVDFSALKTKVAKGPLEQRIAYDGPQSVIYFGNAGLSGDGRVNWPSLVLGELLGGQASFARLNLALREKSGLTYGVSYYSNNCRYADVMVGQFSTATATAAQALAALRQEFASLAATGPTEDELRRIKSYMIGAYALRFADNDSIASEMLSVMQRGEDPGFFKRQPEAINAVTVADVKAAATEVLRPENSIVVVVGK